MTSHPWNECILPKPQFIFSFNSDVLNVEIRTDRLCIYSYKNHDFEDCVSLYGDSEITKYFDHGKPRSRVEVRKYVDERGRKYFDKGEPFGLFSIFDRQGMSFIGQVDLVPFDEPGVVEIGCILHKQYHKQSVGSEAVRVLMFDYVDELIKRGVKSNGAVISKVIGTVHPENLGSKRIIEKFGMTFEKFQERFNSPRLWYSYSPTSKLANNQTHKNSSTNNLTVV